MQALRYVQQLCDLLSEVSDNGGNRALFVVLDHELVGKCRDFAYTYLKGQSATTTEAYSQGDNTTFVADLMSRNIFNSRIRYCVAKLQEFSIPADQQLEFISQAISRYIKNGFAPSSNFSIDNGNRGCDIRDALVIELTNCFAIWYRPDDIFLLDFAVEHCLCSRNLQQRRWELTALGRYFLELSWFDAIITILAAEVALSRRTQSRFVSRELLQQLQSGSREWRGPLPYSLRMFDLVLYDPEHHSSGDNCALTSLGERVVDTVLQSEERLLELIFVMLESEVEGIRTPFSGTAENELQAAINGASLLGSDDKGTVTSAVKLAHHGSYVSAVRTLVPLMERLVDSAISRAKLANPGVGLRKKCGLLVSKGILSEETASYVEIVTARNKVAHGSIGRNDHSLLKPLFALTFNYLGRLIQEAESGVRRVEPT